MPGERRDAAYLWDMLDAAQKVVEFTQGHTAKSLASDFKLRFAVERAMEIIGEAARHVSDGFRLLHPEIPWRQIIGQRNILIHEYGSIDYERVWRVAVEDMPKLVKQLSGLVPSAPEE